MDFAWTMDAADQNLLDIGGPARARDQNHRAGLLGGQGKGGEQFIEPAEHAIATDHGDVNGRKQRDQTRFFAAGEHHERPGVRETEIGAGNSDCGR